MKTQPATGETYPKSDLFNKAEEILQDTWESADDWFC
ncbi:DinI-like family protein [Klebsiella pneumoniae]|nr:DinI-like family protein [Klebsiella pneumoniae]